MPFRILFKAVLTLFIFLVLSGCASYASRIRGPRNYFQQQRYEEAIAELIPLVEKDDNDVLLYMLELGMVYHTAGKYQDAVNLFLKAEKFAEIKDYTSLTQEVGSVILNDSVKVYKGEHFENILINVYLAIDYTLMGKWDDALVECRKVNHKLDLFIKEAKLKYDHNAFAKYLSAALFESQREYNDAFVDYRQVAKWSGDFPYMGMALLRLADKLQTSQEFAEYKKRYPDVTDYKIQKGQGEVVLLLEQGQGPYKMPNPNFRLIPMFVRQSYYSQFVWVSSRTGETKARSHTLFDIEATAIKELDDRAAGIIAKKVGGIVVKQTLAYGVEKATNSEALGLLTALALHLSDEADLRNWTTLPAKLQLARLTLPSGRHDIVIDMVSNGNTKNEVKVFKDVEIKAGKTVFLNYRTNE